MQLLSENNMHRYTVNTIFLNNHHMHHPFCVLFTVILFHCFNVSESYLGYNILFQMKKYLMFCF